MTDTRAATPSLTEQVKTLQAGGPVVSVHMLGDIAAFVLGDSEIVLVGPDGAQTRVAAHGGAILSAAKDGARVVTGGDDGKVVATSAAGESVTVATDAKRRWIDHVAIGPEGALAWSAGKQAFARTGKGEERVVEVPSTVGGLAFAPKGFRLAVAHYNGVTLWFPNAAQAKPERLEWKGSLLDVTFSPDGRFLVAAMQEPMLHGWRLTDTKDMRMSGYASRVRSLVWAGGGKWLATSGSTQLVMWPFQGKDGPMGKQPKLLAPMEARLDVVAAHPKQDVVALGYTDGLVLLVRTEDGAEILARKPGGAPVTAMTWDAAGGLLVWGTEDGEAGLLKL